eukprot:2013312-Rhodomonas_salina.1
MPTTTLCSHQLRAAPHPHTASAPPYSPPPPFPPGITSAFLRPPPFAPAMSATGCTAPDLNGSSARVLPETAPVPSAAAPSPCARPHLSLACPRSLCFSESSFSGLNAGCNTVPTGPAMRFLAVDFEVRSGVIP